MKRFAVAVMACAVAAPALAGGLGAPEAEAPVAAAAAPAASFDWTGAYVGLSYGSGTFSDDGGAKDGGTDGAGVQFGYLRDLGTFVVGGELACAAGDYDAFPPQDWDSTRLTLIGGYDAGRFLPYGFIGLSKYEINQGVPFSDTVTIYGLGARYALGATGKFVVGFEYLVENKDNFDGAGFDMENSEASLRLDYRF